VDLAAWPSATLVIEGRSVGTQVLVDEVRVWTGAVVPPAVRHQQLTPSLDEER
jgi:hypothetical protein